MECDYQQSGFWEMQNMVTLGPWGVNLQVLRAKEKLVHCSIALEHYGFHFTSAHGSYKVEKRKNCWDMLGKWIINGPWINGGDFYAILHHQGRQRKAIVDFSAECALRLLVDSSGLEDNRAKGCNYISCNRHTDQDTRVFYKLDRVLDNGDWLLKHPHPKVGIMTAGASDHSPAINYVEAGPNLGEKPFKFFNVWTDDHALKPIVDKGWTKHVEGYKNV